MPVSLAQLAEQIQNFQPRRLLQPIPQAAVLLAITEEADPKIILTRRAAHLKSHPGQVAFPGGKREQQDLNLYSTALREAEEEIGLLPSQVQPLGALSDVLAINTLRVTPYVGLVPAGLKLQPCEEELDAIFSLPLSWLQQDPRTHTDLIQLDDNTKLYVPSYNYAGYTIWGLSAIILAEFLQVGCQLPLDLYQRPPGKLIYRPPRPVIVS